MLLLSDGPSNSHGKVFFMSRVFDEKKPASEGAATSVKEPALNKFEGKVISITGNKLVMANDAGKEYTHTLASDAKVTCDGTACKSEDLKTGHKIRVTTKTDDRNVITGVESLSRGTEFAACN